MVGAGELTGAGLDLWTSPFGQNLTRFVESGPNLELSRNDCGGAARKRREDNDSAKGVCTVMSDSEGKRIKSTGSGSDNENPKADGDENCGKGADEKSKPAAAEPPKDYIQVRARRGQATDSHSLAERARREKISERMRILQDLVPGCDKVIGKALVLDEVINYIQSLQRQVEFLSMKLEAVNSRMGPGIEGFPFKDVCIVMDSGSSSNVGGADSFLRCSSCHGRTTRKVSRSDANPGRIYYKCCECAKFVCWEDQMNSNDISFAQISVLTKEVHDLRVVVESIDRKLRFIVLCSFIAMLLYAMIRFK